MKNSIVLSALVALALTSPTQAAWQRLGGLKERPVDSASSAIENVEVVSSTGISEPANLLSEDVVLSSRISSGASNVVINLGRQVSIELVELVNDGVEGRVAISSSADNKTWQSLGQSIFSAADRTVTVKFSAVQGKYFKLDFDLSKAGTVRDLRMFGSDSDATLSESEQNFAGTGESRIVYIHPTPVRGDEMATKFNRFEFPESDEKYRTVIYDFGRPRTVAELGSVHSPRPVRMSAYLFESLPETEDWKGRKSFDPAVFDTMTPAAIVEDRLGVGYVKAKLKGSKTARYVALRWEPDFNPPAFSVSSVTVSSGGNGKSSAAGGGTSGNNGSGSGDVVGGPGGGGSVSTGGGSPFSFGAAGGFSGNPGLGTANQNSSAASRPRPRVSGGRR
jgi:hypothetical protein